MKCTVKNCDSEQAARSFCMKHYKRMRKNGTTDKPIRKPKICSVCGKSPHVGKGFCRLHYSRWRRYGDPLMTRTAETGAPLKFLHDAVVMARSGHKECIDWPYGRTDKVGYGWVNYPETTRAHRAALIEFTGENPKHLSALHGPCNNPLCINPLHLSWGTQKKNGEDRARDGTNKNKGTGKLTEAQVLEIRASDEALTILAKRYKISRESIRDARRRITYKWVN